MMTENFIQPTEPTADERADIIRSFMQAIDAIEDEQAQQQLVTIATRKDSSAAHPA